MSVQTRGRWVGVGVAVVCAALAMVVPPARGDDEISTGLASASAVLTDEAHGHLFVASGSTTVEVTDLGGHAVATIGGLGDPAALALSPDGAYVDVALLTSGAIARIDTTTLTVTATYPLPAAMQPFGLVEAGGDIYFDFRLLYGDGGHVGILDLSTGDVQRITPPQGVVDGALQMYSPPDAGGAVYGFPSTYQSIDILLPSYTAAGPNARINDGLPFAVSPDGRTVYAAGTNGVYATEVDGTPGTQTQLSTLSGMIAGAISRDGTALAVADRHGDLCLLDAASGTTIRCLQGSGYIPVAVGLVGDGTAYELVGGYETDGTAVEPGARLRFLNNDGRTAESFRLTVAGDSGFGLYHAIPSGAHVSFDGQLNPQVAGAPVSVIRTGPRAVTAPLPAATTDDHGHFTVTDRPLAVGRYRYHFRYAGALTTAPADAEFDLDVQPPTVDVPIDQGGDVVDDPVHARLFVSQRTTGTVNVYDELGQQLGTIRGVAGAAGLLLSADSSTLYIAAAKADEVVAVDTLTLQTTGQWPTGAAHRPSHLAWIDDRIIIGYVEYDIYHGGLAAFDPSTSGSPVTVLSEPDAGGPFADPLVIGNPARPGTVVAGDDSGTKLYLYQVNATSLTQLAVADACVGQPVLSRDGATVRCGTRVLRYDDLHADGSSFADDVTESPSGALSAGWVQPFPVGPGSDQVRFATAGAPDYTSSVSLLTPNADPIWNGPFAWTSTGTSVATTVVTAQDGNLSGHLVIAPFVVSDPAALIAAVAGTVVAGTSGVLTGRLVNSHGAPISAATLRLSRQDDGGLITALSTTSTVADGTFAVPVPPSPVGTVTYQLAFDGTETEAPAVQTVSVVSHAPAPQATASLSLASPTSGTRLRLAWSGRDATTPVTSYDVSVSDGTHEVYRSAAQSPGAVLISSRPGVTYTARVVATDVLGDTSAPAISRLPVPYDDRRLTFSSGWSRVTSSADYGGSDAVTTRAGRTATFARTAGRIVLWVTTCPTCGRLTVSIPGVPRITVDTYSARVTHRVQFVVFRGSARWRTLTITVTGMHSPRSGGAAVRLDALALSPV